MPDREVAELLRDEPDLLAIAAAVAATQHERRASHARRLLAVAAVIGAAVVLAVAAPWHGRGNGLVGRALAAVGHGPVLHAVLKSTIPNESIVDLSTGATRPVPQSLEYWYDADRRSLRAISTYNGVVVIDSVVPVTSPQPLLDPALTAFVSRYRDALKSGRARQVGKGTFEGQHVVWLRIDYRQFGERVGIDAQTFRPVVIETLGSNGKPIAPTWVVTSIDTRPYVASDFRARAPGVPQLSISGRFRAVAPAKAARILGWTPLWLGRAFGRLPMQHTQLELLTHNPPKPHRLTEGMYFAYGHLADRIQLSESKALEPIFWLQPGVDLQPGTALLRREPVLGHGLVKDECQAEIHIDGVWVTVEGWNAAASRCIEAARALVQVPG